MSEPDFRILSECSIDSPSVSVIVPVYNMEANGFLACCLDSLVEQDLENLEIICIDDASTDGSLNLLLDYSQRNSNITVVEMNKNGKQGAARNRGIDLARGEYIGFVDADDYVDHNFYSSLLEEALASGATLVEAPMQLVDENGKEIGSRRLDYPSEYSGMRRGLTDKERAVLVLRHSSQCSCIFSAAVIKSEANRFLENMFYEDTPTLLRWIYHVQSYSQVENTAYYYRQHSPSTLHTTTIDSEKMKDRLKSSEMILDDAVSLGCYDRYGRALDQYYLCVYYFNSVALAFWHTAPKTKKDWAFLNSLSSRARSRVPYWVRAIRGQDISMKAKIKMLWLLRSPTSYFKVKSWKTRLRTLRKE